MHTKLRLLALLSLGFLPAAAQVLSLEFTGIMTSFSTVGIRDAIGRNSTFTAIASFTPGADATPSTGEQAVYSLTSFSVTVHGINSGEWTATATGLLRNISVNDTTYFDEIQFSAAGASAPTFGAYTANTFNITLTGGNNVLSSLALPTTPAGYTPALWDPYSNGTNTLLKIYFNDNAVNATFRIDAVGVPTPIPEPSTYAVIAGTLAFAGVMVHRRRQAARA